MCTARIGRAGREALGGPCRAAPSSTTGALLLAGGRCTSLTPGAEPTQQAPRTWSLQQHDVSRAREAQQGVWGAAGEAESSVIAHWLPTRGAWRGQPACGGWCGTGRGRRVAAGAGAGARTRTRTSAAGGLARAGVAGTQRRGKCPKIVGSFRNGFEITQTHSTLFGSKAWP